MWFDLAVLWGSSKLIWSHLRPHISPQQTTATVECDDIAPPNLWIHNSCAVLRGKSTGSSMLCGSTTLQTAITNAGVEFEQNWLSNVVEGCVDVQGFAHLAV